jgi:hypothetical protein
MHRRRRSYVATVRERVSYCLISGIQPCHFRMRCEADLTVPLAVRSARGYHP